MNKEEILKHITEEDIYRKYLGHCVLKKMFKSPLRKESTPSFGLYKNKQGRILYKDFGLNGGDCFELVQQMFRISFVKALELIESDFHLSFNSTRPQVRRTLYTQLNKAEEKKKVVFKYEEKNFTTRELKYWEQFGIYYDILKQYNVVPVKFVTQEGWKSPILSTEDNPIFMYKYISGNVRFYRPLNTGHMLKHFGNANANDIFGYEQLFNACYECKGCCETIYICAGQKDCLSVYANTGIRAISLNSESCTLTKEVFAKLKGCADNIMVCYDMDKTGRIYSDKLKKEYGLQDAMLQYPLQTGEKDISDYFLRINKRQKQTI